MLLRKRQLIYCATFVCVLPGHGNSQSVGGVRGTIVAENTGEPLVGAYVVVRGTDQGSITDASGDYFIGGLKAGEFQVEARYPGYRTAVRMALLERGRPIRLDLALEIDPIEMEVINVQVDRPLTRPPLCRSGCDSATVLLFVPQSIQKSGLKCEPTIGMRIDKRGNVLATELLRSSGKEECDGAAVQWARTTRWSPGYFVGEPVAVWVAQPLRIGIK